MAQSRVLIFSVAIGLIVTACAGTGGETGDAFAATGSTGTVTAQDVLPPDTAVSGASSTASQPESTTTSRLPEPQVAVDRVPHGPWFEGPVWMTSITTGGPGLVAAGAVDHRHHTDAAVWTSQDGSTWERIEHDAAVFGGRAVSASTGTDGYQVITDLSFGSLGGVAVGVDGPLNDADAAVWVSADGLEWERVPHDEELFGGDGHQVMRSVVQVAGTAVAVGDSDGRAAVWLSTDARTWTRATIDGAPDADDTTQLTAMNDVTTGGPGLVAVGNVGTNWRPAVWLSVDGTAWTRLPGAITGGSSGVEGGASIFGRMTLVAAGESGLVAVGATADFGWPSFADPVLWTSTDGFEWRLIQPQFEDVPPAVLVSLGDISWDGTQLVAVGGYEPTSPGWDPGLAALWTSNDGGLTWHLGAQETVNLSGAGISDSVYWTPPGATHLTRFGTSFVVAGNDSVPTGERNSAGYEIWARIAAVWIANLAAGN